VLDSPDPFTTPLDRWLVDFGALLLLPLLGVLALTRRRLAPLLLAGVVLWAGLGLVAAVLGPPPVLLSRGGVKEFWMRFAVGLFLGAAITSVAYMREKRRTRRWIQFGLAVLALAGFVRGLQAFLQRYG
jgi:ABC-type Fe3+-siderophore transport system permease subunit